MAKLTPADIAAQTYALTAPKPMSDHDLHRQNLIAAITAKHAAAQHQQQATALHQAVHSQAASLVKATRQHLAMRAAQRLSRKLRGPQ